VLRHALVLILFSCAVQAVEIWSKPPNVEDLSPKSRKPVPLLANLENLKNLKNGEEALWSASTRCDTGRKEEDEEDCHDSEMESDDEEIVNAKEMERDDGEMESEDEDPKPLSSENPGALLFEPWNGIESWNEILEWRSKKVCELLQKIPPPKTFQKRRAFQKLSEEEDLKKISRDRMAEIVCATRLRNHDRNVAQQYQNSPTQMDRTQELVHQILESDLEMLEMLEEKSFEQKKDRYTSCAQERTDIAQKDEMQRNKLKAEVEGNVLALALESENWRRWRRRRRRRRKKRATDRSKLQHMQCGYINHSTSKSVSSVTDEDATTSDTGSDDTEKADSEPDTTGITDSSPESLETASPSSAADATSSPPPSSRLSPPPAQQLTPGPAESVVSASHGTSSTSSSTASSTPAPRLASGSTHKVHIVKNGSTRRVKKIRKEDSGKQNPTQKAPISTVNLSFVVLGGLWGLGVLFGLIYYVATAARPVIDPATNMV